MNEKLLSDLQGKIKEIADEFSYTVLRLHKTDGGVYVFPIAVHAKNFIHACNVLLRKVELEKFDAEKLMTIVSNRARNACVEIERNVAAL